MTDPNVNPNGQVPWQQADANPTEPLNAMTAETGTAANNAPTQAIAAGEQPTQAFTPVEQPTQAFTPAEQVVPEFLRTLVFARPRGDDQFADCTFSPSLDMSR